MSMMAKGDEVLTQGGLVGKIVKISEEKDFIVISLNEQAEVTVQKSAVSAVLPKGTMKSL
jgi:preprotein translocase subunit YajC